MPGLTPDLSSSTDDSKPEISEEHRTRDKSDPASGTTDSPRNDLDSGNESHAHTGEDEEIRIEHNPDSESAPDDEDFAGALPAEEIVPLRRHIRDSYDSDDEETEHHLFQDLYGDGPVARSATSVPWAWWWAMCPKVLIQLCKFVHLLRNELLVMRMPNSLGFELQKECKMRTDKALELMMWLGAVLVFVWKIMPDDHVDGDHQRQKLRMGKLTRQVIRGIWEAYAVVGSVRQVVGGTGSKVREDVERQLKRIHGRCAQRRDMLRTATRGDVDLPQVEGLELFYDKQGLEEAQAEAGDEAEESTTEAAPVVADLGESTSNSAGGPGTIVPARWWKRGRRCSEGSYSLVE